MGWSLDIGMVSTHKYAVKDSGDTVEIAELPDGGAGIVIVDGQGSGPAARTLARSAVRQAWSLLHQGVRASAVAAVISDALYHEKGGKVSVSIDVVCIDRLGGFDIARMSTNRLVLLESRGWTELTTAAEPAARLARQQPDCATFAPDRISGLVLVTDGILGAGERFGGAGSVLDSLADASVESGASVVAEAVFASAFDKDRQRPNDDMTVVACLLSKSQVDQRIEHRSLKRNVR
jgi:hypothetical protein